ncbi:MAG: hypothetical protein V1492_04560 [Candidatus Micrarchaeota archaeon]
MGPIVKKGIEAGKAAEHVTDPRIKAIFEKHGGIETIRRMTPTERRYVGSECAFVLGRKEAEEAITRLQRRAEKTSVPEKKDENKMGALGKVAKVLGIIGGAVIAVTLITGMVHASFTPLIVGMGGLALCFVSITLMAIDAVLFHRHNPQRLE